jgi:hypothetical protein
MAPTFVFTELYSIASHPFWKGSAELLLAGDFSPERASQAPGQAATETITLILR